MSDGIIEVIDQSTVVTEIIEELNRVHIIDELVRVTGEAPAAGTIVEVIGQTVVIEDIISDVQILEIPVLAGPPGPQGPQGPPGIGGAIVYEQATPLATWTISNTLGRLPSVEIYVGGETVEADVTADSTQVSIQFAVPTAGTAVLT